MEGGGNAMGGGRVRQFEVRGRCRKRGRGNACASVTSGARARQCLAFPADKGFGFKLASDYLLASPRHLQRPLARGFPAVPGRLENPAQEEKISG